MKKPLMNYVPKKKQESVKTLEKDLDGYELVLNKGWLYADNNTQIICETIAELREAMKEVEFVGIERYNKILNPNEKEEEEEKKEEKKEVTYFVNKVGKNGTTRKIFKNELETKEFLKTIGIEMIKGGIMIDSQGEQVTVYT